MSAGDFTVGQVLFVVISGYRSDAPPLSTYEASVTKVGRRWVTIGEGYQEKRFDGETMMLDGEGYSSPGAVYFSREEWESTTAASKEWARFQRDVPYRRPDGVTLETIRIAREILGLDP